MFKQFKSYVVVLLLIAAIFIFENYAFSAASMSDEAVLGNKRWSVDSGGNFTPGTDSAYNIGASGNEVAKVYLDAIEATGDLTFQSTLLAIGRVGASSTAASSSTNIYPQGLCYIAKGVGSGGGLDTTPGSNLGAGKKGQILVLSVTKLLTDGVWNVYPKDPITLVETSAVFTQIAFNTVNDSVVLLYVDSTIGWIVVSNDGCTVTYKYWTAPGMALS
jgi:hypothetical protein